MTITTKDMDAFRQHLLEEEKEKSTVRLYLCNVRQFADFMGADELTKERVLDYKAHLMNTYAPGTVNGKLGAVNLFVRFMGAPECCVKRLRIQKQFYLPEERQMTREEYARLVRLAETRGDEKTALCLQILCATGIRVSELHYITVAAARCGRVQVQNKGKVRTILLPGALRGKLLRYAGKNGIADGSVILSATGRPLDRTAVWRRMNRLCSAARVPLSKGHPHALRHLFAVTYYQANRDPMGLADLLGHSSVDTTRIYTATSGAEQARQLEKMGLVL